MEGFGPRSYRDTMGSSRFSPTIISIEETDLWVGIDHASYRRIDQRELTAVIHKEVLSLREAIVSYDATHSGFITSLKPILSDENAPDIIKEMIDATMIAGIGPMGAVAGTVSERVGTYLKEYFSIGEIAVENGGDIFVDIRSDLVLKIFAGGSPLSGKLGMTLSAELSPMGVCTSAGTVGPSLSLGRADAVMIACRNTSLADAYATAFGNLIKSKDDVDSVIDSIRTIDAVLAAVIIKDDKAGICGRCEVNVYR